MSSNSLDAFVADINEIIKKYEFHAFVLAVSFRQDDGTLDEGFKAIGEGKDIVWVLKEVIHRDPKFRTLLEEVLNEN